MIGASTGRRSKPRDLRWALLAVVLTGQFMASLDTTVGNVAAPDIGRELLASPGTVQLAIASYTLLYASLLITGARLGADRGRRNVFLVGVAVFTVSSAVVGLAESAPVLVGARAAQGIGAALMIPQIVSMIQVSFTGTARTRALSAFGAMISVGGAVGLVAGGFLISQNVFGLGWRSLFLVNVPIGVVLFVLAVLVLPRVPVVPRRFDLPGVVLLTSGGILLVLALTQGPDSGWPWWSSAAGIAGIALLAVFAAQQRRTSRRGGPLLIDPALFATPGVRRGLLGLLLLGMPFTGILYCVASNLQVEQHASATAAGLALLPLSVGFGLASTAASLVPLRRQHLPLLVGAVVIGVALLVLGILGLEGRWPETTGPVLVGVAGVGFGMVFTPLLGLTIAHVRPDHIPDVSGMTTTTLQFSFVLGVAVLGGVYHSTGQLTTVLVVMAAIAFAAPLMARLYSLQMY
jgi:MFS family permease